MKNECTKENALATECAQTTNHILMIEPVSFGFNAETAENNYFQHKTVVGQPQALAEFQAMVTTLRNHGVHVMTMKDTLLPHTPDSIFPNNVVSFHANGSAILYPMFAQNRRQELSIKELRRVQRMGFELNEVIDMRPFTDSGMFLEGTGSMILDRTHKLAYACQSDRTDSALFDYTCKRLGFEPILFTANQTVSWQRLPIYHTNVMMSIAETFVVICLDTVDDVDEKHQLMAHFANTDKEVITITEPQMYQFAGNMLQVRTHATDAETALVMSTTAFNSLSAAQIARIENHCPIIHTDVSTIEKVGGGSARCMMAEVFLPRKQRVARQTLLSNP